jgi:hypothetical protein
MQIRNSMRDIGVFLSDVVYVKRMPVTFPRDKKQQNPKWYFQKPAEGRFHNYLLMRLQLNGEMKNIRVWFSQKQ